MQMRTETLKYAEICPYQTTGWQWKKKWKKLYTSNQQPFTPADSQLGDVPFQGAPIALPLHVAVGTSHATHRQCRGYQMANFDPMKPGSSLCQERSRCSQTKHIRTMAAYCRRRWGQSAPGETLLRFLVNDKVRQLRVTSCEIAMLLLYGRWQKIEKSIDHRNALRAWLTGKTASTVAPSGPKWWCQEWRANCPACMGQQWEHLTDGKHVLANCASQMEVS